MLMVAVVVTLMSGYDYFKKNKEELKEVVNDFKDLSEEEIAIKYSTEDARDWKISRAKEDIINNIDKEKCWQTISYRLFDIRETFYSGKQNGFVCNGRFNVMKHLLKNNIGFIAKRGFYNENSPVAFLTKYISDRRGWSSPGMQGAESIFPLYLYPDENSLTNERTPNLNLEIVKEIEEKLGLKFVNEKIEDSTTFAPIDILDYIYAVLHSPSYREKYKEFLKIDFPRVPYPKPETFWQLVSLGGKLRSLHLLEDTSLDERIIDIKGEGELLIKNSLNKKDFSIEDEKVELRLNDEVSVVNIPLVAWEFYIGGYQPAQKWLKDRVGRVLNRADMKHYNRIINALCKTDLIMKKIDEVL